MIVEWAHFCLILAWVLHLPLLWPRWFARTQSSVLCTTKRIHLGQMLLFMIATIILMQRFYMHDFSVAIVSQHSSLSLPWYYCLSALWGGHEGSLLLWVVLLGLWRMLFVSRSTMLVEDTIAVSRVLSFVSLGVTAFLLFASNPMARVFDPVPLNGNDLNPLLQDVGMATHPPMLYIGYVAFAIPYAFALVMFARKQCIDNWQTHLRFWVLLAWSCLGIGITLGSWWAYRELGWGGWWFWDPVENASLMPWLGGTLLLHALSWSKKSDHATSWALMLCLLCFILSLLGTFLVRSGVLVSVHSFAADPARGVWILGLMLVYGGCALAAFLRGSWLKQGTHTSKTWGYFEVNQGVIAAILLTVILGTLYPLVIDVLGLGKMSVGEPYYNLVTPWLILPGLIALGFWAYQHVPHQYSAMIGALLVTVIWITVSRAYAFEHPLALLIAIISFLAFAAHLVIAFRWIQQRKTASWTMLVAHGAFLLLILSIAVAHSTADSRPVMLGVGDSTKVHGYTITLLGVHSVTGDHVHGLDAHVKVQKAGGGVTVLKPGRRIYSVSQVNLGQTDALIHPFYDLYVALGNLNPDTRQWQLHIQYKPMVRWLWLSVFMMSLASIFAWIGRSKEESHA